MRTSDVLETLFRFLIFPAVLGTLYLYLYPILGACAFPPAKSYEAACLIDGRPAVAAEIAPFRLLAFGDPQLEGDTSLPDVGGKSFLDLGAIRENGLTGALSAFVTQDIPRALQGYRKRLDLWGNDLYLAHIYWLVSWWTDPTHVVVLGDLLGSQWIGDEEFERRSKRFWKIFKRTEKVPKDVTDVSGKVEVLGQDERWKKRVIAVAGNHDIGYAGDIDEHRIERFEKAYGRVNWEIRFRLNDTSEQQPASSPFSFGLAPTPPELRLIVLNSMNLDEPAWKPDLQEQSLSFLTSQLSGPGSSTMGTVLLTHIPLHKDAGICADAPYISYFSPGEGGGIKEQNHLSRGVSEFILNGLKPATNRGNAIVLDGHDHEGCDTFHRLAIPSQHSSDSATQDHWEATQYMLSAPLRSNDSITGLREITVRSMMGSYSGNAGLLSAWFDRQAKEWKFDYSTCMLGVQHIWWAVHVLDLVVIGLGLGTVAAAIIEVVQDNRREEEAQSGKAKTA